MWFLYPLVMFEGMGQGHKTTSRLNRTRVTNFGNYLVRREAKSISQARL
jgi:hypothetical protein